MQRGGREGVRIGKRRGNRVEYRQDNHIDGTDTGESDPGDSGGVTGTGGEGSREPTVADLAGILHPHMGQQEARMLD